MQNWEYLVVRIREENWGDSEGRKGTLPKSKLPNQGDWYNSGPLLSALGSIGWELISATSEAHIADPKLYFKRSKL
jgi:hypothetical protein